MSAVGIRASFPRVARVSERIATVPPLTLAGYSGRAAIPEREDQEGLLAPARDRNHFVVDL